jgi:FkbM family methyltransferase
MAVQEMSENFIDWAQQFSIRSGPIIHVGAHLAQERNVYRNLGFQPVLWFEAQPEIASRAQQLLEQFDLQQVRNTALWSVEGVELEFFVAGHEGSSSSLLEPFLISASHPDVSIQSSYRINTSTLDRETASSETEYKIIVLDVQGAELEVLKGGKQTLKNVNYIFSEISTLKLYKNSPHAKDLVKYLDDNGFLFAASHLNRNTGWGEGLFIRKELCDRIPGFSVSHKKVGKLFSKGRLFRSLIIYLRNFNQAFSRSRR